MRNQYKKILLFAFLVAVNFIANAQITSTFDSDTDGWTFFNGSTGASLPGTFNSTGGNPDGYISLTYSSNISITRQSWIAPLKFTGSHVLRSYGMNIKFDLQQSVTGTATSSYGEVRIESGSNVLIYTLTTKPAVAPAWSSYAIKLDDTGGWRWSSTTGTLATQAQIKQVLTNITAIEIRGTYVTNATYTSGLDNVILEQRTLLSAPSIISFSPTSGKPGTVITINGSGFDSTPANNSVSFGVFAGTKAMVQSASTTQLTAVVPEGAAFGSITITNKTTGLSGKSFTTFNPTFDDGGRIIPASFKNRFIISTIQIEGWFVGDFDGDGWEDFAVTNNNTEDVIDIYRNLGQGGALSAASFASKVTIPAPQLGGSGTNGAGLWFADLDGDGKLDAITSNSLSSISAAFVTLRNTSVPGNISFEAPEYWTGGSDETPINLVADLDGDGRPEIMGGEGAICGCVRTDFWFNQNISSPGDIEFGSARGIFNNSVISGFAGAGAGDLNGDGKNELVVTGTQGQSITVLQNTSVPGAPSFTNAFTITTNQYSGSARIVDVNLDGKNDIVYKVSGETGIHIRLNSNTGGNLAASDFVSDIIITSDLNTGGGFNFADVNGDGKVDIAASDTGDFGVYENIYSGGVFNTNAYVPAYQVQGTGGSSSSPVISDLNHDGKPDFVMAGASSITILENKNVVGPQISVNTVSPLAAPIGAIVTITGNNFSAVSTDNEVYFGAVKAMVITATETELTVIVPAGATYAPVSVRRGELTSRYRLPFRTTFSAGVTFDNTHFAPPVNFTLANANYDIEVGDLNRDGLPDILAEANGGFAFRNNHFIGAINTGSLIPDDTLSVNSFINPRIEDFDGDGLLDVTSVNGLAHRNNSTSAEISFEPSITTGLGGSNLDMADFNNDGKIDFVVTADLSGVADLIIRENRSKVGAFTTGTYGTFSGNFVYNKPAASGGVVTEDFDGDGFADVATTNPLTDNISIYLNAGILKVSTAQFASRVDFAVGDNPGRIYKGDFDTDGKVDLMVYHATGTSANLLTIFHNTSTVGNLSFTRIDLTNPSATTVATIADLDGDGKPEIITTSETGNRFSIFKNIHTNGSLSAASFAAPFNTTVTAPRGIATGDLNLDGKPEIILTRAAGLLVVYENLIANPTILSFTPSSGEAGTEVTISGTNFSTVAFENDVRFNNVRAWVKASSATTLTVIIPPNATTGPIKVTVGSNVPATSASDFTVIPFSCPPDPRTNGELDIAFNPLVQDPVTFTAVELQSTGKSIVAAPLVTINGTTYEGILRFNTDGSIDNTFTTANTYFPNKWQMRVMPDDKILVADIGTESYIRRLNAEGSLDNTFNSPSYYASTIHAISYQQDGKVLFSVFDDLQGTNFIYRLNTNGTLDNSFTSIPDLQANAIIQLSDGKILLGGGLVGGVTRLNASGTIDNSFATLGDMDGTVSDLALQSDNKIIAIGSFFSFDGVPVNNIVRLQPNGEIDFSFKSGQAFSPAAGLQLNTVKVLPNDKILVVGEYLTYNSVTRNRIILLNSDGSIDCTFDAQAGPDSMVTDAAIQTDGKILITGSFTSYEGTPRNAFARVMYSNSSITISQQPVNPNNICEGANFVFSTDATGTTNITYQWQKLNISTDQFENLAGNAVYSGVNTKNLSITNAALSEAGNYRCMIKGDLAATVYSNIGTLTVNAKPADPVATNAERCGAGSVTLSATGGAPGEFIWRLDPTSGEPIQNENDPTYTTPDLTVTTTYYVAVANSFCESNYVAVTATINTVPSAPTITPASSCGPGNVVLTASGGTNGLYRWYDVPSGGSEIIGEVNSTYTTPSLTATTTYYVSINNGKCESVRIPVTASIFTAPTKPSITATETITAGVVSLCFQPITLSAPAGFASYTWSSGQTTQQITTTQAGTFTVTVKDQNGCSSPSSDAVQIVTSPSCVNKPPVINSTSVQTVIGGRVTIDLSTLISDPDGNLDPASLVIVGNGTQKGGKTTLSGFTLEIDYANAKFSGNDLVTIRVCDLLNVCFETALQIEVIGDIVVYNGVSPNGDSKNDTWVIEYITLLPDTQTNQVSIYNRWGDLVWEGRNYDNNSVVFSGLNKNGNELPTGNYFYKIQFEGGRPLITGYLSLKR